MTEEDSIARILTDVHAHPTDDPIFSGVEAGGLDRLVERLFAVPLGRVCAMSTNTEDQGLVQSLALQIREEASRCGQRSQIDLRPCFGYHPWYSHTISLQHPPPPKVEHYRKVFAPFLKKESSSQELEAILPHLPEPRSLPEILDEIRGHLEEFPDALLGEVGLDQAFRIPASSISVKDQPSEQSLLISEPSTQNSERNVHTLAPRGQKLTSLTVPIEHQKKILMGQIGLAVELGRSVSLHSVRAGKATSEVLKECCRAYNGAASGTGAFQDVNLDLHSCTLSAEVIQSILRTHPNVFVSFSTTINLRQKHLASQLAVVPPTRLLIESDSHSAESLLERNLSMLRIAAPYLSRSGPTLPRESVGSEVTRHAVASDLESLRDAANVVARNWHRFEGNVRRRCLSVGDADDGADDCEGESIRDFEENWWKIIKQRGLQERGHSP